MAPLNLSRRLPPPTAAVFELARALFDTYCNCLIADGVAFEREYQIEVQGRMKQMDFMISRIRALLSRTEESDEIARRELQATLEKSPTLSDPTQTEALEGLRAHLQSIAPIMINDIEITVMTEAFYYCAGRTRTVMRLKGLFPALGSFEAHGVRDVRNHLLEHPEGSHSTVIENGMAFGAESGPVIKGLRRTGKVHVFPDRGLYVNAQEFASNLEAKLRAALSTAPWRGH